MNQIKGNKNLLSEKEERFSSAGFIFAAIGSSVGLGNMWKFPYITGENGGQLFPSFHRLFGADRVTGAVGRTGYRTQRAW